MADDVTVDDVYPLYFDGIADKHAKLADVAEVYRDFALRLEEMEAEGYELIGPISEGYGEATPGGIEPIEEDEYEYEDDEDEYDDEDEL